ncbi:hypothetical protein PAT3040_03983 [Paenibacillus agaridevorans]|uniref:Uncharacterized protein n=1 Tax=Paenibacillus agaridevorans TaxID=171404 RepID=A0A2R5EUI7_9BACL|nr:hypothetical protein [Paenibacillus agaridevorans]GBG09339.1 hypothetical protein PAT3040_03983 [Paenibacillus agaridevorans]
MRVLLYGLMQNELLIPHLECLTCEEWSAVEQALLVMRPQLLILHEDVATEALEWINVYNPDLPVAVVIRQESVRNQRYWTASGASWVWHERDWTEQLGQAFGAPRESMQEAAEAMFSLPPTSNRETIHIAVAGVYSGVGCTHTALSLAYYLAKRERVAIWEAGPSPCFDFLEYNLGGAMNRKPRFDIARNLTAFKASASLEWIDAVAGDFRYIIYDLGDMTEQPRGLHPIFQSAHLPILVASASLWRQQELLQFCRRHHQVRQDRWRIAFPLASAAVVAEMGEALAGRPAFRMPSHPDLAKSSEENDRALADLLGLAPPLLGKRTSWFSNKS